MRLYPPLQVLNIVDDKEYWGQADPALKLHTSTLATPSTFAKASHVAPLTGLTRSGMLGHNIYIYIVRPACVIALVSCVDFSCVLSAIFQNFGQLLRKIRIKLYEITMRSLSTTCPCL